VRSCLLLSGLHRSLPSASRNFTTFSLRSKIPHKKFEQSPATFF
jgi:hypothetical protein